MRKKKNKICPRCYEKFSKVDKLYHHLKYRHGVDSSNKKNKKG